VHLFFPNYEPLDEVEVTYVPDDAEIIKGAFILDKNHLVFYYYGLAKNSKTDEIVKILYRGRDCFVWQLDSDGNCKERFDYLDGKEMGEYWRRFWEDQKEKAKLSNCEECKKRFEE
jgi:hypothetical protein